MQGDLFSPSVFDAHLRGLTGPFPEKLSWKMFSLCNTKNRLHNNMLYHVIILTTSNLCSRELSAATDEAEKSAAFHKSVKNAGGDAVHLPGFHTIHLVSTLVSVSYTASTKKFNFTKRFVFPAVLRVLRKPENKNIYWSTYLAQFPLKLSHQHLFYAFFEL